MRKVNRKVPQSVKAQHRIDAAVKKALVSSASIDDKSAKYNIVLDPTPRVHTRFVKGASEVQHYTGWVVQNWRRGWLWLSNWMFAAIAWVAIYGVPPEIIALIPEANRENFIPMMSVLGIICRFIDQNRTKPLPPLQGE